MKYPLYEFAVIYSYSSRFCLCNAEKTKLIPEKEVLPGKKGMELSREPVELNSGDWKLNIVPWIGGRILSMTHVPSGNIPMNCFSVYY